MNKIKAVVFDLDDTLIYEYDYIRSGFKEVSKHLEKQTGKPQNDIYNQLLKNFNSDSSKVFNTFYEENSIDYTDDHIATIVRKYREHNPNISFKEGVIPTFQELTKRGYKIGIITDGYKITQQKKISSLKLDHYVDYIIVTDELGRAYWKPHIKPFDLMKNALDVEFKEMIYVGDNPSKDFYIKSKVPITTIKIEDGGLYTNKDYLKNIKEDYKIYSVTEILDLL